MPITINPYVAYCNKISKFINIPLLLLVDDAF
uniref:Uncharacterized protein n=1 Tax=Siphoviridae sp. ctLkp13 TaxID=2826252 RepID=A0A8S5LTA8_9CAUD|nr:MAG TPA: hypothetical protein [Siphoviridae sp. ctLkp13]